VSTHDPRPFGEALRARIRHEVEHALAPRPTLPEGTVTILFTDVEGSTELVRTLGDRRARDVLRRHDALVRQAFDANGGTEVHQSGDGFMAAFRTARSGVACALDIHRRLAAERARTPETPYVRIGMETGEVIAEEDDYFGATVVRASRIADLAGGGETLVSQTVQLLVADAEVDLVDVGGHELKGVGGLHRLYRIEARSGKLP
jgi:class 3 adenylate cyclase